MQEDRIKGKPESGKHQESGYGTMIFMIIFSILFPVIGPAYALIASLSIKRFQGKSIAILVSAGTLMCTVSWLFFYGPRSPDSIRPWEHYRYLEVRNARNILAVNMALEEYWTLHDQTYPEDIDSLLAERSYHLSLGLPKNPYELRRMREIGLNDDPVGGDFTYIPIEIDGKIRGYYLIGYGHYNYEKDHIVLIVTNEDNDYYSDPILKKFCELIG